MTFKQIYEQMGNKVLAIKGNVYLVQSDGYYAVERNTKACGYAMKIGDKEEVVEFFKETIKHTRGSKNNYNLEEYM